MKYQLKTASPLDFFFFFFFQFLSTNLSLSPGNIHHFRLPYRSPTYNDAPQNAKINGSQNSRLSVNSRWQQKQTPTLFFTIPNKGHNFPSLIYWKTVHAKRLSSNWRILLKPWKLVADKVHHQHKTSLFSDPCVREKFAVQNILICLTCDE